LEESDDDFLREALSEQTVVVDPRASLRVSRSVGHLLQQQIREALQGGHAQQQQQSEESTQDAKRAAVLAVCADDTPAALSYAGAAAMPQVCVPYDGALLSAATAAGTAQTEVNVHMTEASVNMTPRGATLDSTAESSVLSPNTGVGRSNIAHEKNVALAREIDTMRLRLQAMGMCGGAYGAQAPTPALSAYPSLAPSLAPSVQVSPAKPKTVPRNFNNTQRQRATPPVFSLGAHDDESKTSTVFAVSAATAPAAVLTVAITAVSTVAGRHSQKSSRS